MDDHSYQCHYHLVDDEGVVTHYPPGMRKEHPGYYVDCPLCFPAPHKHGPACNPFTDERNRNPGFCLEGYPL